MIRQAGFGQISVNGVGGWHLAAFALLSERLSIAVGWWHRRLPLRVLAEQFVVSAQRK
jgi:hypothetical protein